MIDLGVSHKEVYGEPIAVGQSSGDPVFPSFHYSGPKELDLPEEGEMTVRFKKRRESKTTRSGGEKWYECDIEVCCICEVEDNEPDEPTHRDRSAEEALDAIAAALQLK